MLAGASAVAAAPPLRRRMFGAAELHAFEETGYCIFRGVLPQHELAALRGLVEQHVDTRVAELVAEGVAPQSHTAEALEQRWGSVVRDCLRARGDSAELPEFLAHTHWGAPTGRLNARDSGGPYLLLHKAIHELYTSEALVSIAAALLPSARALRAHGDYWFRPAIAKGAFPEAAALADQTTAFPLHQDACVPQSGCTARRFLTETLTVCWRALVS